MLRPTAQRASCRCCRPLPTACPPPASYEPRACLPASPMCLQALTLLFDASYSAVQLVGISVTSPTTIEADWKMGGYLRFPWHPRVEPFLGGRRDLPGPFPGRRCRARGWLDALSAWRWPSLTPSRLPCPCCRPHCVPPERAGADRAAGPDLVHHRHHCACRELHPHRRGQHRHQAEHERVRASVWQPPLR